MWTTGCGSRDDRRGRSSLRSTTRHRHDGTQRARRISGHRPGVDDRDDHVRWERGGGPTPFRSYEGHGAGPVPYPDDTHRGRVGHGGREASRMARQQLTHPPVSRHERQLYTAHQHVGVFHEPGPPRPVRIHPQVHITGVRAGRVRAGRRIRIRVPIRGRGQRVGPYESRALCRVRTPDDEGRPVVQCLTTRYRAGRRRTEAHRGPGGIRFGGRGRAAHSAAPLPAEICHRVRDGGSGSGATYGARAGSPSPSIR